jgi:hypothetical protein
MLCNTSAINKLQKDVLTNKDGCVNVGTPDKDDFTVKCPAQTTVCSELTILFKLNGLQSS